MRERSYVERRIGYRLLTSPEQIGAHRATNWLARHEVAAVRHKKKLKTRSRMYSLNPSSTGIALLRPFVKLNRPFLAFAVLTAFAVSAASAHAGSGCPDDPERCIERGATASHRTVAVAPTTSVATTTPAHASQVTVATRKAPAPLAAPAHKSATKPTRAVSPTTPAPATPGMGMLLKLSNGSGGAVSLFPTSKPTEATQGASWVL